MMYKKHISVFLALCFIFSAFSCNSEKENYESSDETETVSGAQTSVSSEEDEKSFAFDSEDDNSYELISESDEESTVSEEEIFESSESAEESFSSEETSDAVSNIDESSEEDTEQSLDCTSEESSSSEETSEEIDPLLEQTFVIYSPEISYDLSWESEGLELYNTEFRMSDTLAQKFKNQINSFSNAQSIMLIELDTNMTFAYSKDTKIATASSIKGPVGLYVNKCIDAGIISWDTYKSYQPWHFQANSTGTVQNYAYGTAFSVETLMDYMIRISDNQAYLMLKELVGAANFNRMMKTLGSSEIIAPGSNWGYITAKEMASAWREIYYYSLESESGAGLFDRYMHAQYNYIWRAIPQYEAAHKSGWSGKAFNDAGVVFADGHEYVLVVLCGRSGVKDPRSQYQFTAITKLLAELMVEYNAYKAENGL
ncbi:MAG: serine hydrolase [Ruminococcaceae bacterium]|nr:serine hydrolase [Oscillospiraceae bacterium]